MPYPCEHTCFPPEDWEAVNIACHYHPQHVPALMKLRDDMHDHELHVHRKRHVDKNHVIPPQLNVTQRLIDILGDGVKHEFSRTDSALSMVCRVCSVDPELVKQSLR